MDLKNLSFKNFNMTREKMIIIDRKNEDKMVWIILIILSDINIIYGPNIFFHKNQHI